MTYASFLFVFLVPPILLLALMSRRDAARGRAPVGLAQGRPVWLAVGLFMLIAVIYTTPWDNYLVATDVWSYDARRVTGARIGYVPIEEYAFFLLEALLAGLCWLVLARRFRPSGGLRSSRGLRSVTAGIVGAAWLVSLAVLLVAYPPMTYLALILAWALPPIAIQLFFGADILSKHRGLVLSSITLLTIYLSIADSLAIASGIWTIEPATSTGLFIGPLPIEEAVFFAVTASLLVLGLTLVLAEESRARLVGLRQAAISAWTRLKSARPEIRDGPAPEI